MSAERVMVPDEERYIGAMELGALFGYRSRAAASRLSALPGFPEAKRFMPGSDRRWWLPDVKDFQRRLAREVSR